MTDNEHDPQPVRVTDGGTCGKHSLYGTTCVRAKGHYGLHNDEFYGTWGPERSLPPAPRDLAADPRPPGLAARSPAAMDPDPEAPEGYAARIADSVEALLRLYREKRAEVEDKSRLGHAAAERWRAEAEAARAQVGTLTAEVERCREALERIAGPSCAGVNPDWQAEVERCARIAREALGPAREETT